MLRIAVPLSILLMLVTSVCYSSPNFDLSVCYLYQTQSIRLDATCLAEQTPSVVWAELRDEEGMNTLRKSEIRFAEGQRSASITWSRDSLPAGRYRALLWDSAGREILKVAYLDLSATPKWLTNKVGTFDDNWVPKPWTPLNVISSNPLKVGCWGREYTFSTSGFASVQSQGTELLASPMIWNVSVAGRQLKWRQEPTKIRSKAQGAIEFTSSQLADGLRLTCNGCIEFDGFVKFDFRLENTGAPVSLDSLTVDIPQDSKFATLKCYFPKVPVWYGGIGVEGINAGSISSKDWNSVWLPYVWIGDEDKGLQWLCESDEGWKPADDKRALEILPRNNTTTLRLNIIGKPTILDKPRNYTFGFEASPVKPMPTNKYAWHYTHLGGCSDILKNADRMKDLGVRTVDTLTWTEAWARPKVSIQENIPLLQSTVKAAHDRDMKMMVYFAFLLSDATPEYATLIKECGIVDKNAYKCPGFMNDTSYAACQNSVYADFMAAGIDETLRKFDLDGIYSDSMTCIGDCSNRLHGCGYVGEDGVVRPTIEIFGLRDAIKRIYRVLELREKETGREMMFVGHTSANIMLPALGFCSVYLDTEHLTVQPRPCRIPLDTFRAEFMGRNFGIPSETLSYYFCNGGKGLTDQEMIAISLLHDTETPWAIKDANNTWVFPMAPIWKVWDSFGMENTQFMPYWKAWGWQAPDGVKVSAYSKPNGDEMLVVAANLSEQKIHGNLGLNKSIESAIDAFTGSPVTIQNGMITDTFPVWQVKMYRVRLAKSSQ
ncbi:MAG: glycoside hydrolase domain-containing protein [Armatimonadota bacterium]